MTDAPRSTRSPWIEAADRVYTRRYDPCDVNATVVAGADGLLLVDTRCSLAEARELKEDIAALSTAPVRWVVNTHAHFDHVWGNAEFVPPRMEPGAQLWAHHTVPEKFADPDLQKFALWLATQGDGWPEKMAELEVAAPDHLVADSAKIDLGDRAVTLHHLGRGHTSGDIVLVVADADAVICGDLIEQSGAPGYGADSFPLDWPATLGGVLGLGGSVFVPGHGEPVGRDFVVRQHADVTSVAGTITALHAAGVPAAEVPDAGTWPFDPYTWLRDREGFTAAIARSYAALDG